MGFHIVSQSWVTTGSAYAYDENTSFPATNVYPSYTYPNRPWKSLTGATAGGTTMYCAINPGATADYSGYVLVIDNINVSAVTITISDTYGFGTAGSAVSADVTISQDLLADGRYKLYYDLTTLAGQHGGTQQHIGVFTNTATNVTGGTIVEIGTLGLLSGKTTLPYNFGFPYETIPLQAVQENDDFAGGGREPATLGNRYCQLVLSNPNFPNSMKNTLGTIINYGVNPFVFYRNFDATNTQEVYIVHRVGTVRVSQAGPAHMEITNVVLEEVV